MMPNPALLPLDIPLIALIGPTAVGKTELSLQLGQRLGCEIISMDSMQVYRFMDIGTAKATREERDQVPHHLIDICNPDEQYDAARFVRDALVAIQLIHQRGKIPLLVGGTGLYLSSLINGLFTEIKVKDEIRARLRQRLASEGRVALHQELAAVDPETARRVHVNDTQRLLRGLEIYHGSGVPWSEHLRRQQAQHSSSVLGRVLLLGLQCERNLLGDRIEKRTIKMMSDEFRQEVELLLARGYAPCLPSMNSLGYRHMCAHLHGIWDLETATSRLIIDTRRYAKRQMTWFRQYPNLRWFERDQLIELIDSAANFIEHSN